MKPKLPKPVEAWGIVMSDGELSRCAYGVRAFAAENYEPWQGERIIRVRIVPVKSKPRRVRKAKKQ